MNKINQTMKNTRRTFVIYAACGAGTLLTSVNALAQKAATPEMVKDTDSNAVALGYLTDGSKTDAKKYPKYSKDQNCANCALYQGKAADKAGACPLFAGKQVAPKAWCSAWAKKAA